MHILKQSRNYKNTLVLAIGVALLFLLAYPVHAGLVARTGDKISLSEDQVVTGDFYVAGDTLSLSGSVEGDVYAAGRVITINGAVEADAVAVGQTVQIHGAINDDVRVAAGEVTIAEHVGGDLVVFAQKLNILSTATIDGEVLFLGGQADIAGDIGGGVTAYAGSMRIDSAIDGGVDIEIAEALTLGDRAHIEGNVLYKSNNDLVRAPGSVVVGDVRKEAPARDNDGLTPSDAVIPLLALMFSALVYLLLFREHIGPFITTITNRPLFHALIGLAALIGTPIVVVLLFVSVLGIPLAFALLFFFLMVFALAWPLAGIVTGAFLSYLVTKKYSISLVWTVAGVAAFILLGGIPYVGGLIMLGLLSTIVGVVVMKLYEKLR